MTLFISTEVAEISSSQSSIVKSLQRQYLWKSSRELSILKVSLLVTSHEDDDQLTLDDSSTGIVSMARGQDPSSGSSSFFFMYSESPHLDMQYAAFG